MPRILYLGNNTTDLTVSFSLSGKVYEFWMNNPMALSTIEHLAHRISLGKALAYTTRHAKSERVLT